MRFRSTLLPASFLLLSTFAVAQQQPGKPAALVIAAPPSVDCPVGVSARQRSFAELSAVGGAAAAHPGEHGLQVQLDPESGPAIAGVTVRVWGLAPRPRFLLAHGLGDGDVSRQFDLASRGKAGTFLSTLWMGGVSTLVRVDVTEIRYAEGSVWRPSGKTRCTAVPDGFTEISAVR